MKLWERLFGRKAEDDGFIIDELIPVYRVNENTKPEDVIRLAVARGKNIPLEQVTNDLLLGPEGRSIVIGLVVSLGISLYASLDTTVGDLITQLPTASAG